MTAYSLEQLIIGELIRSVTGDGYFANVGKKLNKDMFQNKDCGKAFEVLMDGTTDLLELKKKCGIKVSELISYRLAALDCSVSPIQIDNFINAYTQRKVKGVVVGGMDQIGRGNVFGVMKDMNELVSKVNRIKSDSVVGYKVIDDFSKFEKEITEYTEHGLLGISTGYKELNNLTGGFGKGHVWVLAGYTRTGKSFLVINLMNRLLTNQKSVALFSTEMTNNENIVRMVANRKSLSRYQVVGVNKQEISDKVQDGKDFILGSLESRRLHLYDGIYNVEDIRLECDKLVADKCVDLVFVDYIQDLSVSGKSFFESMRLAAMELRRMAIQLGITIVVVSQISESAQKDADGSVLGYKGAGEIANVANVGIRIKRFRKQREKFRSDEESRYKPMYTDDYKVVLQKVRSGRTGELDYKINFPGGIISET